MGRKGVGGVTLIEQYDNAFKIALSLDSIDETMTYNGHPAWDSIGHMDLVNELEKAFKIRLSLKEIGAFNSYEKGKEIIAKHLNESSSQTQN